VGAMGVRGTAARCAHFALLRSSQCAVPLPEAWLHWRIRGVRGGDQLVWFGSDQPEDDCQSQSVPDVFQILVSPPGLERGHVGADDDLHTTRMIPRQQMGMRTMDSLKAIGCMLALPLRWRCRRGPQLCRGGDATGWVWRGQCQLRLGSMEEASLPSSLPSWQPRVVDILLRLPYYRCAISCAAHEVRLLWRTSVDGTPAGGGGLRAKHGRRRQRCALCRATRLIPELSAPGGVSHTTHSGQAPKELTPCPTRHYRP
jgi:hypothetical protein